MDTKVEEVAAEALIQLKKKRPDSEEEENAMRKIRKVEPRLISYDLTSKFNDLFQPDPARVYGNGREPVPLLQEAVSGSFCLTIPVRVPSIYFKATDVILHFWLTSVREAKSNVFLVSHQEMHSNQFMLRLFSGFSSEQLKRIDWRHNVDLTQCFVRQAVNSPVDAPYFTSNPQDGTTVFFPAVFLHTFSQMPAVYNVELHFKTHKMVVQRIEDTKVVQEECIMRLYSVGGTIT